MAVTITVTPSSTKTATKTVCRIDVTGIPDVSGTTKYYLAAAESGNIKGVSHQFAPSSGGLHTWNNYIFPDDGTWTITLKKVSDNSTVGTSGNITIAA